MTKLIGVTGGTGSGKSTFVRRLVEGLPAGSVAVIPQDSYYKDLSHIPLQQRRDTNFDHPDAFDWPLLMTHIDELQHGRAIEMPVYDYATSSRVSQTVHVEPCPIIIVEGIMTFYNEGLRNKMDLSIFIDAEADERLLRIIKRDIAERALSLDELTVKYRTRIKPMHNRFVEPMKAFAHIIVSTDGDTSQAIQSLRRTMEDYIRLRGFTV